MFIAERVGWIKASCTVALSVKAKTMVSQGIDVIDLGIGEPDLPTPMYIKQAGCDAIMHDKTKYTLMSGIVNLRKAICSRINKTLNSDYKISNCLVGPGAKYLIFESLMATINLGDEVIIPAPYWVSYSDMVLLFGGKPVIIQTDANNNFKLTAQQLSSAITAKTKWLLLNSPCNPTGSIYSVEELKAIAEVVLREKIWVMTDDIYEHLRYNNEEFTNIVKVCPAIKSQTLIVNGFSKGYCMTGWRLGYGLGPEELINAMIKLQTQSTSSICQIVQEAGAVALDNDDGVDIANMVNIYQKRRDLAFDLLNKIPGIKPYLPEGAFYIFADIKDLLDKTANSKKINNDEEFVSYILEDYHVSLVHGTAFGTPGYFRISFATSEDNLKEAIKRIAIGVSYLS